MDIREVCKYVEETSIEELAPLFEVLGREAYKYRLAHEGRVPPGIYPHCFPLLGVGPCVVIVVRIVQKEGIVDYCVKMRGANDQGWQGLYHNPGVVPLMGERTQGVLSRLAKEIFGKGDPDLLQNRELIGIENHSEVPNRYADCWSIVFQLNITAEDFSKLDEEWAIVKPPDFREVPVVDFDLEMIKWVNNQDRDDMVDL